MSIWCRISSICIYRTKIDRGTVVIVAKFLQVFPAPIPATSFF